MTWPYQRCTNIDAPGQPLRQSRRFVYTTGRGAARKHPAFGSRGAVHEPPVHIVPSRRGAVQVPPLVPLQLRLRLP